jgi:hypothetical protein
MNHLNRIRCLVGLLILSAIAYLVVSAITILIINAL